MPKIIFLNGCINAGKTTTATMLKQVVRNLAHVEVDDLHNFISWAPIEQAYSLNIENAIAVTRNFVKAGIDVIFAYPLSKPDYTAIVAQLDDLDAEIIAITLYTSLQQVQSNRGTRVLTPWQHERAAWMFQNGLALPEIGPVIDNSTLSVEQTVDEVIRLAGLLRR
ncbi:MAG: hypothetical protein V4805_06675 [Pseudomonadota bacterium]